MEDTSSGMNFSMPVAPTMGYPVMGGNGFGNSGFGGDWAWILLLLVLFGNGRWGVGGGNGGGDGLYPWMNQSNQISDGFRDQMLGTQVGAIQNGITSGFADVTAAIAAAQSGVTQQMYANQMAGMQQNFALQSQLSQCCCDNRAAVADLKYTVANEACADRAAVTSALQAVSTQNSANTQRILDQMCADKMEAKDDLIQNLRSQLQMAQFNTSLVAHTAQIREGQVAEIDAMYNRMRDCPVPSMPVYGSQPIFSCPNNNTNYGCGCNAM